jgi:hypothetical protein
VAAAGRETGQLHRRFVRLGAAVAEVHPARLPGDGLELHEAVGEAPLHRVVEVRAAHVDEPVGLRLDGGHHARVAVAGTRDGDARAHVEELVAVRVDDPHAFAALGHDRMVAGVAGRDGAVAARDQGARDRSGQRGLQDGTAGHRFLRRRGLYAVPPGRATGSSRPTSPLRRFRGGGGGGARARRGLVGRAGRATGRVGLAAALRAPGSPFGPSGLRSIPAAARGRARPASGSGEAPKNGVNGAP